MVQPLCGSFVVVVDFLFLFTIIKQSLCSLLAGRATGLQRGRNQRHGQHFWGRLTQGGWPSRPWQPFPSPSAFAATHGPCIPNSGCHPWACGQRGAGNTQWDRVPGSMSWWYQQCAGGYAWVITAHVTGTKLDWMCVIQIKCREFTLNAQNSLSIKCTLYYYKIKIFMLYIKCPKATALSKQYQLVTK